MAQLVIAINRLVASISWWLLLLLCRWGLLLTPQVDLFLQYVLSQQLLLTWGNSAKADVDLGRW
jgi:hypothetical protein